MVLSFKCQLEFGILKSENPKSYKKEEIMTTRLKGFTITLEKDIREDDAETLIQVLKMIKGVISVKPIESDPSDTMARERVKWEIRDKFWNFYEENLK